MIDRNIFHSLDDALSATEFAWSLCLIGEDQSDKLLALTNGLKGDVDTGAGKQITSGFSYWGIGPTIAWAHAANDLFYPVMRESLQSFSRRWSKVVRELDDQPYHYVSLGVGTGQKDRQVLRDLTRSNPHILFVPVDMSSEMLRLGIQETIRQIPRGRLLPVQIDFSLRDNVAELLTLLRAVAGDEPVLYSLLGNTLANFEDDAELLVLLTEMLRPQDRLLLEVATAEVLDEQAANEAAIEYANSRAFKEFVTSALWHNTDLTVNMDSVRFRGSVDGDRALLIDVVYQNRTGAPIRVTLPNHTVVDFADQDTIRLYLSRKYSHAGIAALLSGSGLHQLSETRSDFTRNRTRAQFGTDLLLLATAPSAPGPTVAEDIWRPSDRRVR